MLDLRYTEAALEAAETPDRSKVLSALRAAFKSVKAADPKSGKLTVSPYKENDAVVGFRIVYHHLNNEQRTGVLALLAKHGLVITRVEPIGGRWDWSYEVEVYFEADGYKARRTDLP